MVKVIQIFVYMALLAACAGQGQLFASVAAGGADRIMGAAASQKSSSSLQRSGSSSGDDSKSETKPGLLSRVKSTLFSKKSSAKNVAYSEETNLQNQINALREENRALQQEIAKLKILAELGASDEKIAIIKKMPQFQEMSDLEMLIVDFDAISNVAALDLAEKQYVLRMHELLLLEYTKLDSLQSIEGELMQLDQRILDAQKDGVQLSEVAVDAHKENVAALFKRYSRQFIINTSEDLQDLLQNTNKKIADITKTLDYMKQQKSIAIRGNSLVEKANRYYEDL